MKKRIGLLLLVLSTMGGISQGSEETMQTKIERFQLPNGLTVIAKPVHNVPVVSVYMWYRVGSRNEPAGQSGLAHFLEHMLFKGTRQFPKGEIARLIERTGGQQNAFTSYDYTAYYATVPSSYLELALNIEADRMRNALLDAKEFKQERTVILSELDGNHNHPQVRFRELMSAQTWLNHPYRRPIIGWRQEVETLTVAQMKAFYADFYRPSNATLVVVGDFQLKKLKYLLQRNFRSARRSPDVPKQNHLQEVQQGTRRVSLRDFGAAAMVQINLPIPPAGKPEHFAITVLNEVLTKGKTSRLYKALVDKGLATSVSGSPNEMIDQGVWTFRATCQHGVEPAQVEQVMLKELNQIRNHPLLPEEFQRAVNQTRADLIFAKDSITDQAMLLGYYQTVAGDYRLLDLYPQHVAEVTPRQIQQAATTYLNVDQMTIGHFVPAEGPQLGAMAPGMDENQSLKPARFEDDPVALLLQPDMPGPGVNPAVATVGSNPACKRYVLSNGLTLLIQPNPSNAMFVISGLVKGGISQAPDALPGLTTVHATMLDRGTKKRSAEQISEALEFKGIDLSFSDRQELLEISGAGLTEDLELTLEILSEMFSQPTFPAEELEKVRQKVLTTCLIAQDNLDVQAWQGFYDLAYPAGHPMTRSLLNAEAGVKKITQQDLMAYHKERIRPQDTILSLSGDLDPEKTMRLVEKHFSTWQAGVAWQPIPISPMARVETTRRKVIGLKGKKESIVVLGHEGIQRLDPEYYQVFVANQILGGAGLSSVLMQEVRDKAGLTYSVYSQLKLSQGPRPWCVMLQAEPKNVELAVQMVFKQVKRLQQAKVAEEILEDNQERLVGGLALSMENNSGIAYLNREVEYHVLGGNYYEAYARAIRAVTYKDMVEAAKKWLHPDQCLISVAEPESVAADMKQAK